MESPKNSRLLNLDIWLSELVKTSKPLYLDLEYPLKSVIATRHTLHRLGSFMMAGAQDFFQGRDALCGLDHAILKERPHTQQPGLSADDLVWLAFEGHFTDS